MQWLVAIKDHIASSLMIEQDDFEYAPFNQFGGIGRAYELFGDRLTEIMEELNARLASQKPEFLSGSQYKTVLYPARHELNSLELGA